jgi:hypothetical protein
LRDQHRHRRVGEGGNGNFDALFLGLTDNCWAAASDSHAEARANSMATTNVVVRGTEQCFMDGCILSWVNLPADLNTRIPRTSSIARIQAE